MHRVVERDACNSERIFPYIGGEEVNDSPTHAHNRYVINFGEMTEEEARQWPDLMAIVEDRVKPYRDGLKRDAYRLRWWQFGEKQRALYDAIHGLERVLVISRVGQQGAFTFLPSGAVFADSTVVFPLSDQCFASAPCNLVRTKFGHASSHHQ